jgi:hypothetical protein
MPAETGKHQGNKDPRLKEAITSEEREGIGENLRENYRAGDREENSQIFCLVAKNELAIVEGWAPSKTEKRDRTQSEKRKCGSTSHPG